MLELHRQTGHSRRSRPTSTDERFWGREGVVAELYLGYGLSDAPPPQRRARRRRSRAGCRCSPAGSARSPGPAASRPSATSSANGSEAGTTRATAAAIEAVRAAIARGELYQANLVQHLSAPFAGDPWAVALALRHLRPLQPRPFAGAGWTVASASPELFLARRGRRLVTMPIKGTRPLGFDVEGEKDAAEHTMIVDLERNDLARVCEPGSVRWPELMAQRELAGVTHLVSTVEGRAAPAGAAGRDPGGDLPRRLDHRRARRSPPST